jgi:hypothetical protein
MEQSLNEKKKIPQAVLKDLKGNDLDVKERRRYLKEIERRKNFRINKRYI